MQIVIDIPEGKYKTITSYPKEWDEWALNAIKHGTPLPENHGDLIDRNELLQEPLDSANYANNYVRIAKAIIPATKGE